VRGENKPFSNFIRQYPENYTRQSKVILMTNKKLHALSIGTKIGDLG